MLTKISFIYTFIYIYSWQFHTCILCVLIKSTFFLPFLSFPIQNIIFPYNSRVLYLDSLRLLSMVSKFIDSVPSTGARIVYEETHLYMKLTLTPPAIICCQYFLSYCAALFFSTWYKPKHIWERELSIEELPPLD